MVKLEDAVIARLRVQGESFEVLVDPDLALELKSGKSVDLSEVLAVDRVFKDAKKGFKASDELVRRVFGTSDVSKVAEQIIKRGEVQITTEQRRRMREEKLKQLVALISKRAINPQTGLPHPPPRIESAIEEARVHVDIFRSAEEQLPAVAKALQAILPLKFEMRRIAVKIPAAYTGKAYKVVKGFATIKQEEWLDDGSWAVLVELPAGIQAEFFEELNRITKGEVETKVL